MYSRTSTSVCTVGPLFTSVCTVGPLLVCVQWDFYWCVYCTVGPVISNDINFEPLVPRKVVSLNGFRLILNAVLISLHSSTSLSVFSILAHANAILHIHLCVHTVPLNCYIQNCCVCC